MNYLGAMDTETQDGRCFLLSWCRGPGMSGVVPVKSWADALRALTGGKWLTYNMDYDARALIRLMPGIDLKQLFRTKRADWRGVSVYYDPSREFVVNCGTCHFVLYDLAQHFNMSLARAGVVAGIVEEKTKIPVSWYVRMKDIWTGGGWRRRKIESYAKRDAEVCWRVGAWLWDQYRAAGVDDGALSRPLSAGSITARYFRKELESESGLPDWAQNVARQGYAGGRIEVFKRGHFRKVWAYDLKSAYPSIMAGLPDPRGLAVRALDHRASDAVYGVELVDVHIPSGMFPPVPAPLGNYRFGGVKVSGTRIYPEGEFRARLTIPEVDAIRTGGGEAKLIKGCYLCGERRPWKLGKRVRAMFRLRKTRPDMGYALKILLNSLYGKLAQQSSYWAESGMIKRGTVAHGGRFFNRRTQHGGVANCFVAAYITALTRLRLWKDARPYAQNVILFATDSIVSDRAMPWRVGGRMGDWDCQAAGVPAVVVGTGVYSLHYDGAWHDKVRGYRTGREGLLPALRRSRGPIVQVTTRHSYTLGDAVIQGEPLNRILDVRRALDVNFDKKRAWPVPWKSGQAVLRGRQDSKPWLLLGGRK